MTPARWKKGVDYENEERGEENEGEGKIRVRDDGELCREGFVQAA